MHTMSLTQVQRAKECFRQGLPVESGSVREDVLESWKRSRDYGLRLDTVNRHILPTHALRERIRDRQTLYDVAGPFMESLHEFTRGSGFLAILSDEEGYVLNILGDDEIMRQTAEENGLVPGCSRSERVLGTNAVGTALALKHPIQLRADEHYYPLNPKWICSGAPMLDAGGNAIGAFCLTGLQDRVSYHTLGMAVAAAVAITEQMKMKQAYYAIESIQKRMKVIVETMPSGVLLLNPEQEIVQINTRASHLLELPATQIVGRKLHELIGKGLDAESLRQDVDEASVMMERGQRHLPFSMSVRMSSAGDSVITFEKSEALHKKVTRIIGSDAYFTFDDIVGRSPAISEATTLARIAAGNASNVLITGESGTGKELFAQAIHNAGSRRDGPFVAVNCGALPKSLIESELFGYENGTFTGARKGGSAGKFELANGGTIFLDEIGDMPLDVQVSLLRVLQNREVSRLGGSRAVKIDVRVIAASNKNLLAAIADTTFRSDLYYRLNVFNIHVPPLRERQGDIRLLADYFLYKYAAPARKQAQSFTPGVYSLLEQRDWPGNIRELENMIERAVYLSQSEEIGPDAFGRLTGLPPVTWSTPAEQATPESPGRQLAPEDFSLKPRDERLRIENALAATKGNVRKAAELLGVSRRTLYRKMEQFAVDCVELRALRQARTVRL